MAFETWQRVSPYLDQALTLGDRERAEWIARMKSDDPEIASLVETYLMEESSISEKTGLARVQEVVNASVRGLLGQSIGAYTIRSAIGTGGMGTVWVAERSDGQFERKVAIKFLKYALSSQDLKRRFEQEAKILARLSHPFIAALLDVGVSQYGQPCLLIEYVEGTHIDAHCDKHELDTRARIRLFVDVVEAAAHAHTNLIVHRDIKPSNVLVREDGCVKLLDFGIAKLLEDRMGDAFSTNEGAWPMTPAYAAPEQLTNGPISTAADVYALGVLLYVLLTGRHPVGKALNSQAQLFKAILDEEPPRPSVAVLYKESGKPDASEIAACRGTTPEKLARVLRGDLDAIVMKAMRKEPGERYDSASALAQDLRRFLRNEPISARPETMVYRARKLVRRNRTALALSAFVLLAIICGSLGTLVQAHRASLQRDFAMQQARRAAALNEFNHFVLADGAPGTTTVAEVLQRADQIVARQNAAEDPNRLELMMAIGRIYLEQDDSANAMRLLGEAYTLGRKTNDAILRSESACAFASALARDEQLERAENLYQAGLNELPEGTQFALARFDCLQRGAEAAQEANQVWKEVARSEEALRVLGGSGASSDVLELRCWIDLAKAYRSAGVDAKADTAFGKAMTLLASSGRDQTMTAAALLEDWGLYIYQRGRPLEAEAAFKKSINIGLVQNEKRLSPFTLTNYARTLRTLGRVNEAAEYADRAYTEATGTGVQIAIDQSMLERARVYTAQQKTVQAKSLLEQVEVRFRKTLPPGHYAFAALAAAQAQNARAEGDIDRALHLANTAVAIDNAAVKAGADGTFYLPTLLVDRAGLEIEARRPDLASTDLTRAVSGWRGSGRTGPSCIMGRAALLQGQILAAQGKTQEAQSSFRSAAEELRKTLGPDHMDSRRAELLAGVQIEKLQ